MRQVAVLPELQGKGIGTALVKYAEALAGKMGYPAWSSTREKRRFLFTRSWGISESGMRFEEVTIPHWAMEQRLSSERSSWRSRMRQSLLDGDHLQELPLFVIELDRIPAIAPKGVAPRGVELVAMKNPSLTSNVSHTSMGGGIPSLENVATTRL